MASALRIELENLRRAIARDEAFIESVKSAWRAAGAPCCPRCWSGGLNGKLYEVEQKLDRRLARVADIERKIGPRRG